MELRDKYQSMGDKVESLLKVEELESEKNSKVFSKLKILKAKIKDLRAMNNELNQLSHNQLKEIETLQAKSQHQKDHYKAIKEELYQYKQVAS